MPPTAVVGGGTVPAAQWVTAVCAAEATLHGTLQGELDAVKSKSDATAQRQGFVDFFNKELGDRVRAFDDVGAYSSAVVLALIAVATLILMTTLKPKEETR